MKPNFRPAGIADLKVLRQKLVRYEAGEIAHVETVMAYETRSRDHRRLRQDETTTTTTEEHEEESRRDLQTTERFELQHEIQNTIKTDNSFKAGVDLSGTFGPVSLSAFAKYDYSLSKQESDRLATNYAKEVTDKSLNRILDRTTVQRTNRTLEEVEETNKHAFANPSSVSASGVYRWLDKIYRAKVVDYGKRLFYEFVVPEPAVFYLQAQLHRLQLSDAPRRPDPPVDPISKAPLTPAHIKRTNYQLLAGQYAADGVTAPPAQFIRVGRGIAREFSSSNGFVFSESELKLPKGYVADHYNVSAQGIAAGGFWDELLFVGVQQFNPAQTIPPPPPGLLRLSDAVPTSALGVGLTGIVYHIVVTCEVTPEAFQEWQLKTYGSIMQAYRKQLSDYEDSAAALNVQATQLGGRNPELNRAAERQELRRACLALWTNDALPAPDALAFPPPLNYPEFKPAVTAEISDRVKFFDRSFDWENMTYEFVPYYWGAKPRWRDLLAPTDPDPVFEKFLQCGAAVVRVPVQPGAAERILYYQLTGVRIVTGPVPAISPTSSAEAQLYNGYLQELSDPSLTGDIEIPVDIAKDDPDTWLIKVPTTLVWLQADSKLPDNEP